MKINQKEIESELTDEQRYWSLNGTFEALSIITQKLREGQFSSPKQLHNFLISQMEQVHQEMIDYNNHLKIEKEKQANLH